MAKTAATRILVTAAICSGVALLGSCTNRVHITSDPSGAQVRIDGRERGETPLTTQVTWSAGRHNRITLEHPKCHDFSTVLRRTLRVPALENYEMLPTVFFIIGTYGAGTLAFVGPVQNQHFVLAPLPGESDGGAPPAKDEEDARREANAKAATQKAIAEVVDLTGRDEFDKALSLLEELERAYGGTTAYKEKQGVIKALLDAARSAGTPPPGGQAPVLPARGGRPDDAAKRDASSE